MGYWGEAAALGGVDRARSLGARGAAGDLFADGSIGSHTAALRDPYADADHAGHGYLDAAEVRDHVVACTEAGLQAGFHAIGDGALDVVVAGIDEAAERVGADRLRAARHRIEHVEMLAPEHLPVLARLGVVASVQPAFDRLWGGDVRHVRRAARPAARADAQPVRRDGRARHRAGVRVGLAGHAAGPVGQRPRGGPAPDAGLGPRPGRRVRGAHPRRLAGRRPGRRRGA